MQSGSLPVPPAVQASLSGEPRVGHQDAAFTFLTTDDAGFPHVCLLSRAQLEADDHLVRAVVYSARTKQHLDRDGRACLVVVADGTAHYCTLTVQRRRSDGPLAGYAMTLRSHTVDEVPNSELVGLRYTVTPEMPEAEAWRTTRSLLELLR